ncbi:MAG: hypothetical protein CMA67_03645 [Euryarchaeota archaeon]|nr:hypothetical protein [Euryarchaeota archaeon]
MYRMQSRHQRRKNRRRQHAMQSQNRLLSLIGDVQHHPQNHRETWAKHVYKISRKNRIRFTKEAKRLVCRSCAALLIHGTTSRIRLRNGVKIVHCMKCQSTRRIPYKSIKR